MVQIREKKKCSFSTSAFVFETIEDLSFTLNDFNLQRNDENLGLLRLLGRLQFTFTSLGGCTSPLHVHWLAA